MGSRSRAKRERRAGVSPMRVIDTYSEVAGKIIANHFRPDCCLNATRVLVEVMSHFSIIVKPMATKALAFNPIWWDRMSAKGDMPADQAEMDQWVAEGGWSIGVDGHTMGRDPEGWPFHLVGLAAGHIIDSAAAQFNRPARNIHMSSVVVGQFTQMGDDFSGGIDPLVLRNETGTVITYMCLPTMTEHYGLSGFQRTPWNLNVAAEVLAAVKHQLNRRTRGS